MNYVKISEKITELDTLFKSPTPQTSFQNSLLSFEISKMEMIKKKTDDEKADETPKSYFLKKLTFKSSENLTFFESFLGKFLDLQNNTLIEGLLRLHSVYKHDDSLYLVQRNYGKSLMEFKKELSELETFILVKQIIKFYFQMKQEDMFKEFVENQFPLKKLDPELMFYYRRVPNEGLTRYKFKMDMLMFENKVESEGKLDATTFHLKELENMIRELFMPLGNKIGVCGRNLMRLLGDNCKWKEILKHPLFKVDYEVTPNLEFWKIKEEDKRKESFIEKKNAKKDSEEMKEPIDIEKTTKVNPKNYKVGGKFNVVTNKFEEIDKNFENKNKIPKDEENLNPEDALDNGISGSKIGIIKQENKKPEIIKKTQVKPINSHYSNPRNNQDPIILEDHENNSVPPTLSLKNNNLQQEKKMGCGDCRCI